MRQDNLNKDFCQIFTQVTYQTVHPQCRFRLQYDYITVTLNSYHFSCYQQAYSQLDPSYLQQFRLDTLQLNLMLFIFSTDIKLRFIAQNL